mgnify:CR=1 FL=1
MSSDHSPLARLLPYSEQEELQNLIDFSIDMGHTGTADLPAELHLAARTPVAMFLCSSDAEDAVHDSIQPSGAVILVAGSNYAMNGGSGTDGKFAVMGETDGICFCGAKIGPRGIRDGLTHTVAFTETLIGAGDSPDASSRPDLQVYRAKIGAPAALESTAAAGVEAAIAASSGWDGTRSTFWLRGYPPAGPIMNGRLTPNHPMPDLLSRAARLTGPRSRHPGGVNACFCDGSVRFIDDSIAPTTWHALWTRGGGEIVRLD